MACLADCFRDNQEIRPIVSPTKLVWLYFGVSDEPAGTLQARQFQVCPCGCDKLVANPSASKDSGPWLSGK